MMTTLLGAVGAVALLSVMLLIHEVGHFVVAKLGGVTVEEFGFGYPPRLVTLFRRNGTEYTVNAIPFGAFVRMRGEDDSQGPGSFVSKPKRLRAAVLLAGAGMNIVMAVLMLTAAFMVGYPVLQQGARVVRVMEESAAAEAGLRAGDIILQMDDTVLADFGDLSPYVSERPGLPIELAVRRGEEILFVDVTPRSEQGAGRLGIEFNPALELRRFPLGEAFAQGLRGTGQFLWLTISLPALLLRGSVPLEAARPVGPVGIYQLASSATRYLVDSGRWFAVLELGGMLNAAVALTNLLPLPGLDGGRLLFILAEAIRGKRVTPEREGTIHFIGLVVLVLVALIITIQDVAVGLPTVDWSQLGL